MAQDAQLAQRIRTALANRSDVAEKAMFGGICFLLHGNMAAGTTQGRLVLRVGPEGHDDAMAQPHAQPMDFTGKPMRGFLFVAPEGVTTDAALGQWLSRATAYVDTLPAKAVKAPKPRKAKAAPGKANGKAKAQGKAAPLDTPFTGFPKEAFAFLRGIAQHNEKAWFQAHQAEYHALYDTGIRFAAALGSKLKPVSPKLRFDPRINGSVFRINRDVRFSKDKSPYKPHLDLWFWVGAHKGWEVPGCFFRMFAHKLILGAGMHTFQRDQLERYRKAVLDPKSGEALAALCAKLEKAGYRWADPVRKQVPRGFDPAHPRAALLLHESAYAVYDGPVPREASSAKFVDFCLKHCRATWPVSEWLMKHVVR